MSIVSISIDQSKARSQKSLETLAKLKKLFFFLLLIKKMKASLVASSSYFYNIYLIKTLIICPKKNFEIKCLILLQLRSIPLISRKRR